MSINALPREICLEIFSYLNLREVGIASSVSRKWRELLSCDAIWSSFLKLLSINENSGGSKSLVIKKIAELRTNSEFGTWQSVESLISLCRLGLCTWEKVHLCVQDLAKKRLVQGRSMMQGAYCRFAADYLKQSLLTPSEVRAFEQADPLHKKQKLSQNKF